MPFHPFPLPTPLPRVLLAGSVLHGVRKQWSSSLDFALSSPPHEELEREARNKNKMRGNAVHCTH